MITVTVPETWQDLQIDVARILAECGMEAYIAHKIQSVRTEIEIDVFATEDVESRRYTIICECKRRKSSIPQETVHGVRTVMHDVGANKGFIISIGGFQSGAYAAAQAPTWNSSPGTSSRRSSNDCG